MSLGKLQKRVQSSLNTVENNKSIVLDLDLVNEELYDSEPILLPWQIELINEKESVCVISKGRQIGFSNISGLKAVLLAISNERDTIVNSYNLLSSREFLKAVIYYARIFNQVFNIVSNTEIIENRFIGSLQLTFNNGRTITSVSGDTTNLRGKPGAFIVIDELAYRDIEISKILDSANATLIHGGSIWLGSTHCGVDSDFHNFIKDVDSGKYPYVHYHVPFMTAVNQGLYKRICLKNKVVWTQQLQNEWVKEIYAMYGIGSKQELDAIPSNFENEGDIFSVFTYTTNTNYSDYERYLEIRYIDLAASTNEASFYTASIKIVLDIIDKSIVILDWFAEQLNPSDGDDKIIEIVTNDSPRCITVLEQEPGSSAIKYIEIMKKRFNDKGYHRIDSYRPVLSKLQRLIPVATSVSRGEVKVLDTPENRKLVQYLVRVCNKKIPKVSDLGDCLSGIYDYAMNKINYDLYF